MNEMNLYWVGVVAFMTSGIVFMGIGAIGLISIRPTPLKETGRAFVMLGVFLIIATAIWPRSFDNLDAFDQRNGGIHTLPLRLRVGDEVTAVDGTFLKIEGVNEDGSANILIGVHDLNPKVIRETDKIGFIRRDPNNTAVQEQKH